MDISNTLLTGSVSSPQVLPFTEDIDKASDGRKKQLAKDFESVFVKKLLDQMNESIGNLGLEKDQVFSQVKGIFNMYMSQHISSSGGLGLWQEIYKSLNKTEQTVNPGIEAIDEKG